MTPTLTRFEDLTLKSLLKQAIAEMGFEKPSPIQAETLPLLLGDATDFIGLAATGTGKTAAFSIPLLERLDPSQKNVQALILCPTRELALQVAGQINLLGKHLGLRALTVYGGASYGDQIRGLKQGMPIVVGTPGRVVDHLDRGTLKLENLSTIILDEADKMISMGFKEDLEKILGSAPSGQSKTWLFSATMGPDVRKVADRYLKKPKQVQINRTEMLSTTVEQIYYMTQESHKAEVLCKLIDAADDFYGIVFCQTKSLVTDLTQHLKGLGYPVDCLHGDLDQNARERVMRAFRDRKVRVLICTDVASRGLDVKNITHVINYSIPRELDSYVHRIGRTARSGQSGIAMSLVTSSHRPLIGRIERLTKSKMREGKVPTRKEIARKKISAALETFKAQSSFELALELLDAEWKKSLNEMSREEIAARFLAQRFAETFAQSEKTEAPRPAFAAREEEAPARVRRAPGGWKSSAHSDGFPKKTFGKSFGPRRDRDSREFPGKPRRFEGGSKPPWSKDSRPNRSEIRPSGFAKRAEWSPSSRSKSSIVPRAHVARGSTR